MVGVESGEKASSGLWSIDLGWFEARNRSFDTLARTCLCPTHRRLGAALAAAEVIKTIKTCCSKQPDFLSERMSVLETIFRLLLARGNEPFRLAELGRILAELRGTGRLSQPATLSRLLEGDQYYGVRHVG